MTDKRENAEKVINSVRLLPSPNGVAANVHVDIKHMHQLDNSDEHMYREGYVIVARNILQQHDKFYDVTTWVDKTISS